MVRVDESDERRRLRCKQKNHLTSWRKECRGDSTQGSLDDPLINSNFNFDDLENQELDCMYTWIYSKKLFPNASMLGTSRAKKAPEFILRRV
jgi:hypothetical protein